jgi:glycosyltransferase involved in cell wall biosynthesis
VLAQTRNDFELIVIDDGSTDGSAEVVASIDDRRIRLIHQENQGVSMTRNNAVLEAKSDIVVFIDGDDEWLPSHLDNIASLIQRHPDAAMFFTAFWVDRGGGWRRRIRMTGRGLGRGVSLVKDYFTMAAGKNLPSASAARKDAILSAGGYRSMFGEDVDFWFRMAAANLVAYSDEATAVWHLDAENRRCDEQEEKESVYQPGSLLSSLRQIVDTPKIPRAVKTQATLYVEARERRAITANLLAGRRSHAATLYAWWSKQFGKRSMFLAMLFKLPTPLLLLLGKARTYGERAMSLTAYLVCWPLSSKTFRHRSNVAPN